MNSARFLRRFLLPGAVPVAVVSKDGQGQDPKTAALRPSELPIYPTPRKKIEKVEIEEEPSALEEGIGVVREELSVLFNEVQKYSNCAAGVIKDNWESSNALLDYLKEEENVLPRSQAIGLATVTGFVLGLRGGWFKRLLYSAVGGGAMASICYPREAEEYLEEGLRNGRQYALVGYHLVSSMVEDLTGSSSSSEGASKKDTEEKSTK